MSLFSKLFGGGASSAPNPEPTVYEGFRITPTPIKEGSRWRISARIEKEIGGETKTHTLIRADDLDSKDTADAASIAKAKAMIDQMGERVFG
ncbi:MAG: HlyU family transcriptional regulator [Paracoccaceae bacterium]|nr:HlyU family transcriptional regulator [Paracoccaceae bacterium]